MKSKERRRERKEREGETGEKEREERGDREKEIVIGIRLRRFGESRITCIGVV